jgi:steroid delta-isomerase-like uncharacterized protein
MDLKYGRGSHVRRGEQDHRAPALGRGLESGDLAVADAIFDEAYAAHEKAFVPLIRAAFPDSHHTIEDLIAAGDKVVTRFTWSGTHHGEFEGIPPTGRPISVQGIWIHRLKDGRIVEGRDWGQVDWLGLLRQLGALPDPT